MDTIHLFYSWQSDTDGDVCRHFIRRALVEASARIEDERGIAVLVDSDTAGVTGTPPVTDTILDKIRVCDIFVADMTFVAATTSTPPKLLPNPNVMAEYGFARSILGNNRILLVMNTAFGPQEELPFDLRAMRFPTAYQAPPEIGDGARRAKRTALSNTLAGFISAIADEILVERGEASVAPSEIREQTEQRLTEFDAQNIMAEPPAIIEQPFLTVRLLPSAALKGVRIDPQTVKGLRPRFVPAGFVANHRQDMTDARQFASFDRLRPRHRRPNPESYWYLRILQSGFLELSCTIGIRIDDDRTIIVSGRQLEARIIDAVGRLASLAHEIGFAGTFACMGGLQGIEDVQIDRCDKLSRPMRRPGLHLGSAFLAGPDISATELRHMLDAFWLEAGFEEGSPSFPQENWQGHSDNPLYQLDP
jgi:hypothetical protein